MKLKNILPALLAALILQAVPSRADLITWGGGLGNEFYGPTGSSLDSSYWFELGAFGNSFTPTPTNYNDWAANWKVFDRATTTGAGDLPQWDPAIPVLAGSANNLMSGGTSKAPYLTLLPSDPNYVNIDLLYDFRGQAAYILVFKDRTSIDNGGWGLYTGMTPGANPGDPSTPWAFPTSINADCGCALGADFNLANITSSVVGSFTQTTNDGSTQTILTLAMAPEPSSAILIFATGIVLLLRKRRSFAGPR